MPWYINLSLSISSFVKFSLAFESHQTVGVSLSSTFFNIRRVLPSLKTSVDERLKDMQDRYCGLKSLSVIPARYHRYQNQEKVCGISDSIPKIGVRNFVIIELIGLTILKCSQYMDIYTCTCILVTCGSHKIKI